MGVGAIDRHALFAAAQLGHPGEAAAGARVRTCIILPEERVRFVTPQFSLGDVR